MTLIEEDRARVWRCFMRYLSRTQGADKLSGVLKQDVMDAVDATDDWVEANQTSFNTALPLTFRTNASQMQKTLLLCLVAMARVSVAFLRKAGYEVD